MDTPINPMPPSTVPPNPNPIQMDQVTINPKSSSGALKFFIILLVLVLLGGSAFAAYKYFFSAKYSPESAVENMVGELAKVKSLAYQASIDYNVSNVPTTEMPYPGGTIKIGLNGATDWHDTGNILSQNDVSVDYSDPQGAMTIGGALNTLVVAKTLYLKLTKVPDLGFFDISVLKDQWIKLEPSNASMVGVNADDAALAEAKIKLKEAVKIINEAKILKITEKLGKEKIGEIETYHLKLSVDKTELKKLVRKLDDLDNDLAPAEDRAYGEELIKIDKQIDELKMDEFEIWVGINDALPYRLTSDTKDLDFEGMKISGKTKIDLSKYNQPLTLIAPTDAKTFEEVMTLVMGTSSSSTPASSTPAF